MLWEPPDDISDRGQRRMQKRLLSEYTSLGTSFPFRQSGAERRCQQALGGPALAAARGDTPIRVRAASWPIAATVYRQFLVHEVQPSRVRLGPRIVDVHRVSDLGFP